MWVLDIPFAPGTRSRLLGGRAVEYAAAVRDRIKTDRRDSLKLAGLARAGELTPIYVPEAADEAMRDLVRAREDSVATQRQARHRLAALLLRHDIRYCGYSSRMLSCQVPVIAK
jgi:transposase